MGALSDIAYHTRDSIPPSFYLFKGDGPKLFNQSFCMPAYAQMGGAAPDAGVLEIGPGIGVVKPVS